MFYPKIKTLYTRDERFKVNASAQFYTEPVFGNIKNWLLTEKVDGTNMSVAVNRYHLDDRITELTVRGRTANAQLGMMQQAIDSVGLGSDTLQYPDEEVSVHNGMRNLLEAYDLHSLEIFGEAYGPKIQSGGFYGDTQRFAVYDMRANGKTWLPWDAVVANAATLGLDTVPVVQHSGTIPFARHLVQQGFSSQLTSDDRVCEGIVARPATGELTDNNGKRVCWKLKHSDF